ncbi:hypothetical protein Gohar_017338, partial [Gossypium harknessii]|nr:hypothetical protein [Gossypium harknessii]
MEKAKENLSLDDDEEETIQLGVEPSHRETSYANCFVGIFLTSSVIWKMVDSYFVFILKSMLIKMLIHDLPHGFMSEVVARQLGSSIGDISLRAQSKRNVAWRSRWLMEDGGDGSSNYGNSTNMYGRRNLRRSQSIPVDQGTNVGFPPKISYSLKGKPNISSIPGPTKVGELGQNNNKDKNNFDEDMAMYPTLIDWYALLNTSSGSNEIYKLERLGFGKALNSSTWKNECKASFRSFSRRHIDIMMDGDSDGKNWRCTDFYGALEENLREAYWNLLCCLNDCPQIPCVLHFCIDEAQSAFVLSRLISDNILAAYEVLHSMKKRRLGKQGSFALKLNMSKAYDRVEWPFIKLMLRKMGYSELWVQKIMR